MNERLKLATTTTQEPDTTLDDVIARTVAQVVARTAPAVQPMELRTFEELERWAERAARSKMVPKDYAGQPDNIILAVQLGSELGLRPMQALQSIAVINGRPAVWGDAMLALCMTHPLYRGVKECFTGEGDERAAVCVAQRQGDAAKTGRFSMADAKRAGLWDKPIWKQYPDRMLQMRARGFALRDAFSDKLRGLIAAEEAEDFSLEAAGIVPAMSAAPPPAPEPAPPKPMTAEEWATTTKARFDAALTYEAVQELVGDDKLMRALEKLERTRPDLYGPVEQARQDAMDRTIDRAPPPAAATDDGWPGPQTGGNA